MKALREAFLQSLESRWVQYVYALTLFVGAKWLVLVWSKNSDAVLFGTAFFVLLFISITRLADGMITAARQNEVE